MINKLPKTGGINAIINKATDLPICLRDLKAKKQHTPRPRINVMKMIDNATLINSMFL